ncbi:MAG: tyrosine-type recombinase/integrase [archaeon]|nr:tyrosine-type recombinase/integrase [archaeon]
MNEWLIFKTNSKTPESETAYNSLSKKNKDKFEEWFKEKNNRSEKRKGNIRRSLIRFLTFIKKDWDKITYDDYVNTASALDKSFKEEKISSYQFNEDVTNIKNFLEECFDDSEKRFKRFKLFKQKRKDESKAIKPNDLLTDLDIDKMMKATSDMKKISLVAVLHISGARPEELLKSRYNDVDFNKKQIYLYSGKTKRRRAVYIGDTISHLTRLKKETNSKEDDLIFPSVRGGIMTIMGLNFLLQDLGKKAGLKKKIWSYLFRHSRLSFLITKLSPKVYEEVSGHSLAMGMKTYAHLSQDKIIKEMKENVFQVEDMTPGEKNKLEDLEKKMKEFEAIKKFLPLMKKINQMTESQKLKVIQKSK